MALEDLGDGVGEVGRVDGLGDEPVAADRQRGFPVAFGSDGDDGDLLERLNAAQAQCDLVAVEVGDVDVHEDQIGLGITG